MNIECFKVATLKGKTHGCIHICGNCLKCHSHYFFGTPRKSTVYMEMDILINMKTIYNMDNYMIPNSIHLEKRA